MNAMPMLSIKMQEAQMYLKSHFLALPPQITAPAVATKAIVAKPNPAVA